MLLYEIEFLIEKSKGAITMSNQVTESIIVQGSVDHIYNLWADFENFPNFMKDIKSIKKTGNRTSHWVIEGPHQTMVEWTAEMTRLEPNKRIAWSSTGGDIKTSGQVTFATLPQGETEITVTLHYAPSADLASNVATELFSDIEDRLIRDLRNFKAYAEGMKDRIV
jgi:uncharacterized membrane protein